MRPDKSDLQVTVDMHAEIMLLKDQQQAAGANCRGAVATPLPPHILAMLQRRSAAAAKQLTGKGRRSSGRRIKNGWMD